MGTCCDGYEFCGGRGVTSVGDGSGLPCSGGGSNGEGTSKGKKSSWHTMTPVIGPLH